MTARFEKKRRSLIFLRHLGPQACCGGGRRLPMRRNSAKAVTRPPGLSPWRYAPPEADEKSWFDWAGVGASWHALG